MLEAIVLQTGHQLLSTASGSSSDGGCGRFMVGSKNIIIFHDCNIAVLTGVDLVSPVLSYSFSPLLTQPICNWDQPPFPQTLKARGGPE